MQISFFSSSVNTYGWVVRDVAPGGINPPRACTVALTPLGQAVLGVTDTGRAVRRTRQCTQRSLKVRTWLAPVAVLACTS